LLFALLCSPGSPQASLFLSTPGPPKLTFIIGPGGAGKTTCCAAAVRQARAAGLTVGGILSPGVFEGEQRTGIDLLNLGSGERRRLATRCCSKNDGIRVGRWSLHPASVDWGNCFLRELAICDLFVLDELGPLEFDQLGGFQAGMRLLDEGRYNAALVVVRPALLPAALSRWPDAHVFKLDKRAL
jgi:nucleoside-triphosphatase THEP1